MIDYTKLQLASDASSNKLVKEGSGTYTVAALGGAGEAFAVHTIPHNLGTDKLIFQVSTSSDLAGADIDVMLPWQSNDGSTYIWAAIDSANLYIYRMQTSNFGGFPSATVKYTYRILVP